MNFLNFLKRQSNLKQINVSEDEDFVDLRLTVTKYWRDEFQNHTIRAKGLWGKEMVGFELSFRPDMKLGIVNTDVDKTRFYQEGINFHSIGVLSDNFVSALNILLTTDKTPMKMVSRIASTTFVLSGEPSYFEDEYIKTKIFFNISGKKDRYAEWYVNVDLKNNILELREKDPAYRRNIINILTGS
ncbi:hypothetical protein HX021_18360 [Sphingobacterium sp. N143]|uniref:hypothetical protein n=1 Tax=Sphingobacterium sp. N143 TaxID=2746727 RepID=UPI0025779428|nr:hypothetical protein [Sphingobacterium sp. N143]MDM1296252.1 hypothetical protein [Sphingobacterium sp. N143]